MSTMSAAKTKITELSKKQLVTMVLHQRRQLIEAHDTFNLTVTEMAEDLMQALEEVMEELDISGTACERARDLLLEGLDAPSPPDERLIALVDDKTSDETEVSSTTDGSDSNESETEHSSSESDRSDSSSESDHSESESEDGGTSP